MNKEKIEQVNRLTPKTQISTLSTGRKMLLPRQSPIAPFFVHLSLSLAPTWGISVSKRYFVSLCYVKGQEIQ